MLTRGGILCQLLTMCAGGRGIRMERYEGNDRRAAE